MKQYILIDMDLIDNEDKGLNNNDKLAYSLLYNRMISSVKQGGLFFDDKRKEFYVIYTLEQMASKLHVTERTAGEIYKRLEAQGMLTRQKQKYSADKIFLPLFDMEDARRNISKDVLDSESASPQNRVTEETSSQYPKKFHANYVYSNYKNKHNDTVDTENGKKETEIKKLRTAVIGKSHMHPNAVDAVIKYANYDANKVEQLIGVIYCAKKSVAKSSGLLHAKITRFENNDHMNIGLFSRLNHIFSYADKAQNPNGYIYNALISYFIKEFGLAHDERVTPQEQRTTQGHNAPVFDCLKEDDKDIPQPKLVDSLALAEALRRHELSGYPNDSKQSEIKARIETILTENGIDPSATAIPTDKDGLLEVINADIATV